MIITAHFQLILLTWKTWSRGNIQDFHGYAEVVGSNLPDTLLKKSLSLISLSRFLSLSNTHALSFEFFLFYYSIRRDVSSLSINHPTPFFSVNKSFFIDTKITRAFFILVENAP